VKKRSFFSPGREVGLRRGGPLRALWRRIDWRWGGSSAPPSAAEPPVLLPRMTRREIRAVTRALIGSLDK
jgi:hypothetical protein